MDVSGNGDPKEFFRNYGKCGAAVSFTNYSRSRLILPLMIRVYVMLANPLGAPQYKVQIVFLVLSRMARISAALLRIVAAFW